MFLYERDQPSQDSILPRRFSNLHCHPRDDKMLGLVAPYSMAHNEYLLWMPNLDPPILTADKALRYNERILTAANGRFPHCKLLMTIQITEETTPEMIRAAAKAGVKAGKLYIRGVTNNSQHGVRLEKFWDLKPVFEAMAACGMLLLIHGTVPRDVAYFLDEETEFLPFLRKLASEFRVLKIVLEHITTKKAVNTVRELYHKYGNVAATITPPHMVLTTNDILGPKLFPHHFCQPVAKTEEDRLALVEAATSGEPMFFLGTDSAPHSIWSKQCHDCFAGMFSDPVAHALVTQVFAGVRKLNKLEAFASLNGPAYYGLPAPQERIKLVRKLWRVPALISCAFGDPELLQYTDHRLDTSRIRLLLERYGMPSEDINWDQERGSLSVYDRLHVEPFLAGKLLAWQVVA